MTKGRLFEVDVGEWPLVGVALRGELSDDQCAYFFNQIAELLRRDERFGIVADLRTAARMSPRQRTLSADLLRNNRDGFARLCVGMSVAVSSRIIQGAINAVLWVVPAPCPIKSHPSLDAAMGWITSELAQARVAIPEGASARLFAQLDAHE